MAKTLYRVTVDKTGVKKEVFINDARKTRDGDYRPKNGDYISISVSEIDKIKCNPIRLSVNTQSIGYDESKYVIDFSKNYMVIIYTFTPENYKDSELIEFRKRKRDEQIVDIFKQINSEN